MKTTLDLDAALVRKVKRKASRLGIPFAIAVEEALRRWLLSFSADPPAKNRNPDCLEAVLEGFCPELIWTGMGAFRKKWMAGSDLPTAMLYQALIWKG